MVTNADTPINNTLAAAELKRRGMAAIEDGLRRGPLQLIKRNKPAAVVLSAADYQRMAQKQGKRTVPGMTALQWLLGKPATGKRSKAQMDALLKAERNW